MQMMSMFEPGRWMPRKNESPMSYWISLSPAAPLFGVAWRFADAVPAAPVMPAAAPMAAPGAPYVAQSPVVEPLVEAARQTHATFADAGGVATDAAAANGTRAIETARDMVETLGVPDAVPEGRETVDPPMERPANLLDAAPETIDNLKQIKGVGPKLERELNEMGIYAFSQIAAFSEANLVWVDAKLSSIKGRPMRDDWVGQAARLMGA